jgi:hypothetical protein
MILREYTRRARAEHFCDYCCNWILPGQTYTARVMLPYRSKLYVLKCHDTPGCPAPEGDTDKTRVSVPYLRLAHAA